MIVRVSRASLLVAAKSWVASTGRVSCGSGKGEGRGNTGEGEGVALHRGYVGTIRRDPGDYLDGTTLYGGEYAIAGDCGAVGGLVAGVGDAPGDLAGVGVRTEVGGKGEYSMYFQAARQGPPPSAARVRVLAKRVISMLWLRVAPL